MATSSTTSFRIYPESLLIFKRNTSACAKITRNADSVIETSEEFMV